MYRKWESRLHELFYSHVDRINGGLSFPCWHLADWQWLMEHCGFHEDASFTREEANLCFYLAKFETVDYLKDRNR